MTNSPIESSIEVWQPLNKWPNHRSVLICRRTLILTVLQELLHRLQENQEPKALCQMKIALQIYPCVVIVRGEVIDSQPSFALAFS